MTCLTTRFKNTLRKCKNFPRCSTIDMQHAKIGIEKGYIQRGKMYDKDFKKSYWIYYLTPKGEQAIST